MRHVGIVLVIAAALLGLFFSGFATYDFVAHLDRQVHGIHCSFVPGIGPADVSGASGCHVTMMSRFSSVFRDAIWGGIPVSLPAMSVFAFLLFWALVIVLRRRGNDTRATGFLALSTLLPVGASIVMGYLSVVELDATCKLCVGIYVASALSLAGALMSWLGARREAVSGFAAEQPPSRMPAGLLAGAFGVGVLFVAVPVAAYAGFAPDFSRYVGACGEIIDSSNEEQVLLPLGPQARPVEMIELLDPLCPACKGFEDRFDAWEGKDKLRRLAVLFPLDNACNWMVNSAVHPGACTVSEAMLCAGDRAEDVLDWAFDNQEAIREAAQSDPEAAGRMVRARFPELADCIGSPKVRARLNLALRWAVDNQVPVLTPQVYVNGVRMCDEDTDLGMEWAMAKLLEQATLRGPRPKKEPEREQRVTEREEVAAAPAAKRDVAAAPAAKRDKVIVLEPGTEPTPQRAAQVERADAGVAAQGAADAGSPEQAHEGDARAGTLAEGARDDAQRTGAAQGRDSETPGGATDAPAARDDADESPGAADDPAQPGSIDEAPAEPDADDLDPQEQAL